MNIVKKKHSQQHQREEHQHEYHAEHEHSDHAHHGHGDHESMIADFKRRFFITLALAIPIIILSDMIQMFFHYSLTFPGDSAVELILSTIVFFYGGWPFIMGLASEIKSKSPGMMTLIGFAITVAYVYSVATVFGIEGMDFFWELATLIAIMLLGHWLR